LVLTPISVIIPARNEGNRIVRTVRSIVAGRSCSFPLEVVVVDDASTDGTHARLEQTIKPAPEVRFVLRQLRTWSGIAHTRNRGAEAASYPIYLMTDANTVFPLNWDLPIWRHFDRRRLLAGTIGDLASSFRGHGCTLLFPSMGVTWLTNPGAYGGYVPVAACPCTVMDRALFHHLGGYDESLAPYGVAEPEFSVRAWLSGYEIVNVPDLLILHRFRPREEYDAFRRSIEGVMRRKFLRFACYYLPEKLLKQTYDHYAAEAPRDIAACWAELEASGVWERRAELKKLPRDFRWFAGKFGLTSASN
jgi:glycosyltransferase involved in cell wall biosynthesis